MALTLLEASKLNDGDVKRQAVIEMFAANSDLLRVLPFEDIAGGSVTYNLEGELPGVAFRGINEAYPESTGIINPATEILRIVGGDLDVDKALIKTRGAQVRSSQEAMKIKSMALHIADQIVNGDSEANPRVFDGLRKRIVGDQLHDAGGTDGGDPLSLFLLDDAIDSVDSPTHLLMNKQMRNRLSQAAKTGVGGDIQWDKDEFGRRIARYNDLPILIADYDNEGKQIMGFDEVGQGGATATASSIYVMSIGDGKVSGIQNGVMEVNDLGEIDEKPVFRTRVEWLASLLVEHGRAAARIRGISNAPVVA